MSLKTLLRAHMYDSAKADEESKEFNKKKAAARMSLDDSARKFEMMSARMDAGAIVEVWAQEGDLEDEETFADRLTAMIIGAADINIDGDLTGDEIEVANEVGAAVYDYFLALGVEESDAAAVLNGDEDAAMRIRDFISEFGEDDFNVDEFVFGEDAQDSLYDAAYKKAVAVRDGKKVMINKRISGAVKLSPKQKAALRKAQMKSHGAGAKMKRMKSMKVRKKMGI
ncbi:MAG: hypothetical protein ACRCWB_11535 [Enterovibrio sp.]